MEHTLTISHDKVFAKAELLTSYQAAKDGTDFDACRIKKADKEIINSYYDEAVAELDQYLLHYIKSQECECSADMLTDWTVVLDLGEYPAQHLTALDNLAHDVCATYVTGKWLAMLMSKQQAGSFEAATLMAQQHQQTVEKFKHILNERTRPIRLVQRPY